MSLWLWVDLSLGALFVLAIVGIPLWIVVKRPDTGPDTAAAPAWRSHAAQGAMAVPAQRPADWPYAEEALARSRGEAERPRAAGGQRMARRTGQAGALTQG